MNSQPHTGSIILVHGAWADGSCWSNVILPLKQHSFDVVCAPIPLTSLTDDAIVLRHVIERTSGPVVLVGHAYAGAVIAAVRDERVKALVYVAALAPDEGETVGDVFYRGTPHMEAPKLAPDNYGFIWMPTDGFSRAVAHKASADQHAIMAAVQRPIALQCIQEKVPTPAWKSKPSWYLLAEEDRMITREKQQYMADRMKATLRSYPVDHTPMYAAPDVVVDTILLAASETIKQ
jgi:pimeloyl-ACP methyl ester carboxylesterase